MWIVSKYVCYLLPLLINRDSKTWMWFLDMSTRNCLINKTKLVIKMLLSTAVCGTTGIPAFKSTAAIIWPPPPTMVLLPCCSLSPPALPCHPGLSQLPPGRGEGPWWLSCSCLLTLQVQRQFLACALLHALLVELVNCWRSQKVRPWCVFTQCKWRITWQAVGEAALVRWCRSQFPPLVLELSLKHHCCCQADLSWQPWLRQTRKQDKSWVQIPALSLEMK